MVDDYRNTMYCSPLNNIKEKKHNVAEIVKNDHCKAKDMHAYISKNDDKYKRLFMKAYNNKCSYCGVSVALEPKVLFEVDHFINQKSKIFKTKKDAGCIENLVLACHDCNHNKGGFSITDNEYAFLYPDDDNIKKTFYRDENYYIRLSENAKKNTNIKSFYQKLKLGSEIHRLDYLLMNLIGFQRNHNDSIELYKVLGIAIDILREKRNMM